MPTKNSINLSCENCGAPLSVRNLEECMYCGSATRFNLSYGNNLNHHFPVMGTHMAVYPVFETASAIFNWKTQSLR